MSVVTVDTGTELMQIGGAAVTVGSVIVGFGATLPDTTLGSPRDLATAAGMAVSAVGGVLISLGAYLHTRLHRTVPPPPVVQQVTKT